MYKRIVVKVGSRVISDEGRLNEEAVREIVSQISELRAKGIEVILVTSGATATGKGLLSVNEKTHSKDDRQVYASVGQIRLMYLYAKYFSEMGHLCGQILVTKGDFRDKEHYANIKKTFENLLRKDIVPVVNENDAIAISELVFSDNDELAGLIASQINANAVIMLSSVDGVMINAGGAVSSIPEVYSDTAQEVEKHIDSSTSASGRGGMKTKFEIAKKLMKQGIITHILDGKRTRAILDIVEGKHIGTKFNPEGKLSAVKRRLSHAEGFSAGSAYVNEGAEKILLTQKSCSLLPVGVTKIEGNFKKGDIIEVKGVTGNRLGFGIAQYGAKDAQDFMGKKGAKELIHCDYLLIG